MTINSFDFYLAKNSMFLVGNRELVGASAQQHGFMFELL